MEPQAFWQEVRRDPPPVAPYGPVFPGVLADGWIPCPVRVLPGDGTAAVASLILNQASFAVQDALAAALAARLSAHAPEVVVGVPTLGLSLAAAVARGLGHRRFVALGTSRKFWYEERLSVPVTSITSPDAAKRLWLDPRMLPLLAGRPVALVDDVFSTGRTLRAALALLEAAGVVPVVCGAAMVQGQGWRDVPATVEAAFATPRLVRHGDGWWPEGA
jgi:adenine/guanine phosphoribosyltransferase-like PRPP-binding protein